MRARASSSTTPTTPRVRSMRTTRIAVSARPTHRARARTTTRAVNDEVVDPPRGRAHAFEQASVAVARALEKTTKKASKKRRSSGRALSATRLAVELPVMDDSDEGTIEMATATLGDAARDATVVFGSASALEAAREGSGVEYECVGIDETWTPAMASERKGVIALVGVSADGVEVAARKCRAGEGRPVVCVNVEWEHDGDGGLAHAMSRQKAGIDDQPMTEVEAFANSFVVVYSFLPLSIQANMFGSTLEGAVFKCVRGGAPAGTPWRILVKEKGVFEQVGAMQRRPQQEDLEAALYNSIGAKSAQKNPLNSLLRGIMGNKDKN